MSHAHKYKLTTAHIKPVAARKTLEKNKHTKREGEMERKEKEKMVRRKKNDHKTHKTSHNQEPHNKHKNNQKIPTKQSKQATTRGHTISTQIIRK